MAKKKKKADYLEQNKITYVDYKNIDLLRKFIAPHGKILNRKRTGLNQKSQKMVTKAIKRARHMALLPFVPHS